MDQKSPEAFRTISEVAEWLGVPTHVLRFWESRFSQVKPVKRAGGRRYYRPSDMELLGGIRQLLHEDGMTIRGVQKLLREKGVKHVAALSPPLDVAVAAKDVTPDNIVDLADRREADTAADTPDSDQENQDAPWYDTGIFAQAPSASTPEPTPAEPGAEGVEPADAGATEAEVAEPAAQAAAPEPEAGEPAPQPEPEIAEPATPPRDLSDPLPDPATMDFLAHDAQPDTFEPEAGNEAPPAPAEPAAPVVTDPTDPLSSPEALEFAAHDAEPETTATMAEPETTATAAEPARAPAPSLQMPDIGPDPDDQAGAPDLPLTAASLRAARRARAALNTATLQALADRLEEISTRMAEHPGRRGGI